MKSTVASWVLAGLIQTGVLHAEPRAIITQQSVITLHVYKSGVFSAFGHDHEITAAISKGQVDASKPFVEFVVEANALKVVDAGVSAKDRTEIQTTMEGPKVLDATRFHEIRFRSTSIQKSGANQWTVHGELTLHGTTHPVIGEVSERAGHYVGSATLNQRDFGMTPVSVAGGAVKVKDQVKLAFDIVTEH
jgi:polyisoprenoid-binding protein YceI